MYCHIRYHAMNQMDPGLMSAVGMHAHGLDEKVRNLLPAYMTMGEAGMGGMGAMGMRVPENSIPMVGAEGPFGYIDMGGMFTIVKVRKDITSYDEPGWYQHPQGTVA